MYFLTFGDATGFYAGLWGSNVDFNDGHEAKVEVDVSGGYKFNLGAATIDLGGILYAYPGASSDLEYNYVEAKAAAAFPVGPATLTFSAFYSPDYFSGSGSALYLNSAVSAPIGDTGFSVNAAIGHQSIEDNANFALPDYVDWNLGASYAWKKFTFGVNYYDTNLSKSDCADGCEGRIVGSVTMSF